LDSGIDPLFTGRQNLLETYFGSSAPPKNCNALRFSGSGDAQPLAVRKRTAKLRNYRRGAIGGETVAVTFDEMIHSERSRLLKKLPTGAKVVCSAGCAGSWYFQWFEECYGYVPVHIGVELHSPKPTDLPKNVRWIQNSVRAMHEIRNDSVDLMFSGQNIEHLSPSDILGFLKEANRVIRHGGFLCIDSPNRSVTVAGRYVQPEHVLELSTDEAIRLFELAGFNVVEKYGIWLCQTATGERLAIADFDESSSHERCREAHLNPERSFIWWIVGRKVREANTLFLETMIQNLFLKDFPGFVRARHCLGVGAMVTAAGTEATVAVQSDVCGYVYYGPYVPLIEGKYQAEFVYRRLPATRGSARTEDADGFLQFDVCADSGSRIVAVKRFQPEAGHDWRREIIEFQLARYSTAIEARAYSKGFNAEFRFGASILRVG